MEELKNLYKNYDARLKEGKDVSRYLPLIEEAEREYLEKIESTIKNKVDEYFHEFRAEVDIHYLYSPNQPSTIEGKVKSLHTPILTPDPIPNPQPAPVPDPEPNFRTRMYVTFPDGTIFNHSKAAVNFVETVKKLGIQRCKDAVEALRLYKGSLPIIYESIKRKSGATQFNIGNNHWLITDYNNEKKKEIILKITDYLHEDLVVDVFVPNREEKIPKPPIESPDKPKRRGPSLGLKVTFPNGKVVKENEAVDTYCETIMQIGVGNVFDATIDHGITLNGVNIISDTKDPKYGASQRALGHGWWLMTHSNTPQKKDVLEKLSHHLGLGLKIEMFEKVDKLTPNNGLFGEK